MLLHSTWLSIIFNALACSWTQCDREPCLFACMRATSRLRSEGGVASLCVKLYLQSVEKSPLPKQKHFFYSCVCFASVCLEAECSEGMNPASCHVKHISVLQMWFSLGWRPKRLAKPHCLPLLFFLFSPSVCQQLFYKGLQKTSAMARL